MPVSSPSFPFIGFTDPVSSLTHLLGALIFAILAVPLVRRGRGSPARTAALAVFAVTVVFALSMSGVFHLLPNGGRGRAVLQRLDHAAIFALIAGSFTPTHTILFRGAWRWGMLLLIWTIAAAGITLKTVFFSDLPESLGLAMYLAMGWIGLASGTVLYRRVGFTFIRPLVWGALAYTAGAVTDFLREPVIIPGVLGPHEVFHLAVLAGVSFHWVFIRRFAGATEAIGYEALGFPTVSEAAAGATGGLPGLPASADATSLATRADKPPVAPDVTWRPCGDPAPGGMREAGR